MGTRTLSSIITEGLELAGNTGLTARARAWVNSFVNTAHARHNWHFLRQRYGPFNIAKGDKSITLGDGTNITDKITHIRRIYIADTVDSGFKGELTVTEAGEDEAADIPDWIDGDSQGTPLRAYVEPASATSMYQFKAFFAPVPDKAYRIQVLAQRKHADLSEGGSDDGNTVFYPNDDTLIHAVYVAALRHQDDPRFAVEEQALMRKVTADYISFGKPPGQAPKLRLSSRVFRRPRY